MYLWIKALHVVAIIAWMAGMLYLPRLFVYHAASTGHSEQAATFKVMERRLLRFIMMPALLVAWSSGLWLAVQAGYFQAGWFHAKLALVVGLSGLHGLFAAYTRRFAEDENRHAQAYYRVVNEIPTLLMIAIVILVVVKPF
jgi:putative membrane protein